MTSRYTTPRRHVASSRRTVLRAGALVWLGVLASWNAVSAQVGYDPAHSPYHDIPRGAVWALSVGHLGGSRGDVGVGPADGLTGALRYEVPFGAVGASLGLAYARTSRFVEDYTKDSTSDRKSTRLNSSHRCISYAVFCLKKKKQRQKRRKDLNNVSHRACTAQPYR